MFKIGNRVRWGRRNKNDTTRGSQSFYNYNGTVSAFEEDIIVVDFLAQNIQGNLSPAQARFRQLRNGAWIHIAEKTNDPKGRLNLTIDVE